MLKPSQLTWMYSQGYRYYLTLVGEPAVSSLCVKTLSEIGPLMRSYPEYTLRGQKIHEDGTLEGTLETS